MTSIIRFEVPGEPVSKQRARVVNGHAYTPAKTVKAEQVIQARFAEALRDRWNTHSDRYTVIAEFHCKNRRRRDIDNMFKLVLDALNGWAWDDDSAVTAIAATKTQADEPKTVVTITAGAMA